MRLDSVPAQKTLNDSTKVTLKMETNKFKTFFGIKIHSLKSYRAEKIVAAVPRQSLIESWRGARMSCCVPESSKTIQSLHFRRFFKSSESLSWLHNRAGLNEKTSELPRA